MIDTCLTLIVAGSPRNNHNQVYDIWPFMTHIPLLNPHKNAD